VRIPDAAWDSTPRSQVGDGGWGATRNRRWDAPTPRAVRTGSPDDEEGALGLDAREWEEEQIRLDRDWYMGAEEGALAGDEEHNPLAMYDDLEPKKQAELEKKQVVSWSLNTHYPCKHDSLFLRKRFQRDRRNMYVLCPCVVAYVLTAPSERGQRPLGSQPHGYVWCCNQKGGGSGL
jgi:hypothetical protein